jgi:type VI secretion system secreted protein VgrG
MTTEHFTLTLPEFAGAIKIASVTGAEAMSSLYHFDVHVLVRHAEEELMSRGLETPATLTLMFDQAPARAIHGIVSSCEATGLADRGLTGYVLRIVPRMARMEQRTTSRIFQDQTTREIVEYVLGLSNIQNRWQLARSLQKRAYCVQHEESDYAFVARMLASEGIFYSFEHPIDAHEAKGDGGFRAEEILLLADTVHGYAPLDGGHDLRFRPMGEGGSAVMAQEDHIQSFHFRHAMRSKRVLFRRFDFERPPLPHRDHASLDDAPAIGDLDTARQFVDTGTTIHEHQQTRESALIDPVAARTALEAERADAALADGDTACRRLLPGRVFRLMDHTQPGVDGPFVVVSTSVEAHTPEHNVANKPVFRNRFTAVPATIPFRPARPRRAVRQSLETATVVGPLGEEIHTDKFGRIKVQFHWDLQGKFNEKSSTWLRVLQPWAGFGYGAQFLPRIGHEVLVGFIDGDADRPIVLGSLHNGINPAPYTYPRDAAMSGIKTWTTPDGQGGHELLFDDQFGKELVTLRSNRTMVLSAAQNSTLSAGADLHLTVGGDRTDEVVGDLIVDVDGSERRTTDGARSAGVGGDDVLEVKGSRRVRVGGDERNHVEGNQDNVVVGSRSTTVGANLDHPSHEALGVTGQYRLGSGREMELTSEKQIHLSCGDSKITLFPDHIVIESPTIQLQAKKRIALVQGDPPAATLVLAGSASLAAGTVTAQGGGPNGPSKLVLDANAHLDAPLVKLNCGSGGGGGASVLRTDEERATVQFTMSPKGLPAGTTSVTLHIATPSGEVVERACPVGGSVVMEGFKGDVFTVVDARVKDQSLRVERADEPKKSNQ